MAQKSLLDFEEALQRLQQMEHDQAAILELISKLKTLVQKAEGRAKDVEERLAAADQRLAEAKATADSLKTTVEELQKEASKSFSELERFQKKADDDATRMLTDAQERVGELEKTLDQEQSKWCEQQQAAFSSFHKKHLEALDELTKAYDRQKIVYDTVKVGTETLQAALDRVSSELRERAEGLRTEVNEKVETATSSLQSRMQAWMTEVHAEVDGKVRGVEEKNEQLQSEVRRRSRRIWLGFLALCAVLLVYMFWNAPSKSSKPARLWTDRTGKYTVEASLESCLDGTVQLSKSSGGVVNVPLERLSKADQEYVKQSMVNAPSR